MSTLPSTIRSWQRSLPLPHTLCVGTGKKTAENLKSGKRLADARRAKDFTLEQLAKLVGTSASRLGNYEQGTRKLPLSVARACGAALGVSAAYLMGVVDEDDNDVLMLPSAVRVHLLQAIRKLQQQD